MTADLALASLCANQLGVVTHRQLAGAGLSGEQIANRIERRLIVPIHRGVYRHAAAPITPTTRLLGAVLACGPGAAASHRSAARLHGLRAIPGWRPEVTVAGTRLPLLDGVTVHRTDTLDPTDVASVGRVPVTTVARTLLDLGAVVPFGYVEVAAQDALIRNQVGIVDLICALERLGGRGRRGTAALRAVVGNSLPRLGVESMLEMALQRLVDRCPIPRPVLQHEILLPDGQRFRLDSAWPAALVTIEADGRRWHSTRRDFERDMARIRAITAAGWQHYRYGWNDVHRRPEAVMAEITTVVSRALATPNVVGSAVRRTADPTRNGRGATERRVS